MEISSICIHRGFEKKLILISDGKLTDNKLVGFNSWYVTPLTTAASAFPTSQESQHGWPTSSTIGKNVFPLNLNLLLFMGVMLQGHSQSIVPNNKKQNKARTKIKSKTNKQKIIMPSKSMFSWVWCVFFKQRLVESSTFSSLQLQRKSNMCSNYGILYYCTFVS